MEPTWLGSMTADLGMDQQFFAIELHVGKDYRISASDDVELQLTHACLGPSTPASVATCLQCTTFDDDDDSDDDEDGDGDADKTTAVLGRYKVGGRDNGQLEITLHDESVLLSLVGGVKGQSTLHLSGRMVLVPGLDDAATESAVRVVESSSRAGWTPTKEDPGLKRKADGSIDAVYTPDTKKPRKKPDGGDPVADAKAEAKKSGAKKEAERARTEKAKEKAAQQQPKVFTPSRKFAGPRAGFVFKKGKKGVGYYPDVRPPTITAAQLKAIRKAPAEGRDPGQGGWQKGPSGLKFKTMRSGNGPKPKRGKSVKCRYLLRLTNDRGRIVDKSPPSGFSFRLGVGEVIKAWDLALADMRKGEKRALLVPPNLGYGANGAPPDIPGRATLYFEVEHC